jgi:hypothetical protein
MSPSSRFISSVSLDLAEVTPQQMLAFAAGLSIVVVVLCGALIVLGWSFTRCSPSNRRDITSLVVAVVRGLSRRERS